MIGLAQPIEIYKIGVGQQEPTGRPMSAPDNGRGGVAQQQRQPDKGESGATEPVVPASNPAPSSTPKPAVIGVICSGDLAVHRDEIKAALSRGLVERPDAVWVCIEPKSDRITHDVMISLDIEPVVLPMNPAWRSTARSTTVVHSKREPYDVYIGRPSKWGNPFSHKDRTLAEFRVGSRDEAVDAYAEWIQTQPDLIKSIPELFGKVLGCWCHPQRCHGDVLSEMANRLYPEYDLRRLWRDLEMLHLCDEIVIFHKRTANSPWRDRAKTGLYDRKLFIVEVGPQPKAKGRKSRKPIGA